MGEVMDEREAELEKENVEVSELGLRSAVVFPRLLSKSGVALRHGILGAGNEGGDC